MTELLELITAERDQFGIFIGISLVVLALTSVLFSRNSAPFQRFFGDFNPLVVVLVVFILGLILFGFLLANTQLAIFKQHNFKGILHAAALAIPFAVVIILVDLKAVFPENMNVLFPDSLLFYPTIAYVVEILFHVLPLALLYLLLAALFGEANYTKIIWVGILVIPLIEAIFQARFSAGQEARWAVAYVAVHVYLIGFVQLWLFKRYDFVSMYSFRLVYYLLWHILWGHVRLGVLF